MNSPFDVIVAGAGPAGAATALRLARAGLRVAAVDRAVFPRDKICSEYMSPEGVRHLAALGLLTKVERQGGCAIRGTTVYAAGGSSLTGLFARTAPPPFRETGLSVSRRILDQTLVSAARDAGVQVMEGTTVLGVLRKEKGLAGLLVRDREDRVRELPARLTVGADGLRSLVARAMNARRTGRLRRYAFVAHIAGVSGLRDLAELHVGADGYVGLNPLGGGVANVALVVPQDRARRAGGRTEAFFFEELARFPGVRDRMRRDAMYCSVSCRVLACDGA